MCRDTSCRDVVPGRGSCYTTDMKRKWFLSAALLAAAFSVWGQSAAVWAEIEFSIGEDVTILRDNKPVPVDQLVGFRLNEGDQVQTGKGTFLELKIKPAGGMLKLSENTVFVLSSLSDSPERGFRLVYGRVRAKVDKLSRGSSFNIASDSVAAGVRGTDFGYDVLTVRTDGSGAQIPITRVYCFEGSVLVTVSPAPDAPPSELKVKAGNMVAVEQSEGKWVPSLVPVPSDIRAFWNQNDFAAASKPSGVIDLPTYARVQANLKVKNAAIFGGVVLVGLGSVLQGVGAYAYSSGDPVLGLNAVAGGAFLSILSLPVLIFGLSTNPVFPGE